MSLGQTERFALMALDKEGGFMKPPRFSKNKKSAFTLLELVVTLVITAVTAVVAIPVAGSSNAMQVKLAADGVANHLHYAQQLAMTTRKPHGVSFDTGTETYQVYYESSMGGAETILTDPLKPENLVIDLKKDPFKTVNINTATFSNSGGSITNNKVIFETQYGIPKVDNNSATPPDVATGTVTLSRGGITRTVTVEPTTGKVTVQ